MTKRSLRVGLVVPHIFMHQDILPKVIFSPGQLAKDLAEGLTEQGVEVTLLTPGPVQTTVRTVTADLTLFEAELAGRGDTYIDLLKKHPFTFVSLSRQVQAEIIAKAYTMANDGQFDVVHIYTNEEDIALPFAELCKVPVVFTHHDPLNFWVKYKNTFPKFKHLPWISFSLAQRESMPEDTNWVGNVYHGLDDEQLAPVKNPSEDYVAYLGRIIEPKGVHLAIEAVKKYNQIAESPVKLKIAGKHYAGGGKDNYWQEKIEPELSGLVEYVGFIGESAEKQQFLGSARALLVPSLFDEPFGMVSIEAFACGTPVIGLDSGALPEVIEDNRSGYVVEKIRNSDGEVDEPATVDGLVLAISKLGDISRSDCRAAYEERFTVENMVAEYMKIYQELAR